jgi:hypothetical protein
MVALEISDNEDVNKQFVTRWLPLQLMVALEIGDNEDVNKQDAVIVDFMRSLS